MHACTPQDKEVDVYAHHTATDNSVHVTKYHSDNEMSLYQSLGVCCISGKGSARLL